MEFVVRAIDIWFSYTDSEYVLKGVNLVAEPGKVSVVVGPTGCGKTTLLLVLSGLLKPMKGVVLYNDKPLDRELPGIRRYIGVLFQDPDDQLFNSTVYDEIAYSLRSLGLPEYDIEKKVLDIARSLGIERYLDRAPYRLSYGEKKKVALASILVYEPRVLFLDEPTANIDGETEALLIKTIAKLKKERTTIVITTHDIDFALKVADKVYLMIGGEIVKNMDWHQLLDLDSQILRKPLILELRHQQGLLGDDDLINAIKEIRKRYQLD